MPSEPMKCGSVKVWGSVGKCGEVEMWLVLVSLSPSLFGFSVFRFASLRSLTFKEWEDIWSRRFMSPSLMTLRSASAAPR